MNRFKKSDVFEAWFRGLKDLKARARILGRINSAENGNFGDYEPVGGGVSEMGIHCGPGYRLYSTRQGEVVYLLLIGETKARRKGTSNALSKWRQSLERNGYGYVQ